MSPTIAEITINLMRLTFHLYDRWLHLTHVLLMTIEWTSIHTIDAHHLMHLHPTRVKRSPVPWALHLRAPLTLPRGSTRTLAWTRMVLPRVCATSACGSAWRCHVALCAMLHPRGSHVPRQLRGFCGEIKPLFLHFLKE